jgi:hypothetical protein
MTDAAETPEQARALIRDVLEGGITPETHPWVFEEDMLLFSVRRLEVADPEWLLAQLAETRHPLAVRATILYDMRDHYEQGLEILRREDPAQFS